ncbi:MAG TPA: anthranilate synthase component I [Candidatus Krumholzibacteria bacterium]|nr:anthranilate synthase component I [Candidatus Krumholzibacteria bacterium]
MTDHDATGRTPLRLRIPADLETPVSAYLKLRDRGAAFLLESVEQGVQLGRYSFIGLGPCTEIRLRGDVVTVTRPDGAVEEHPAGDDIFAPVRAELARSAADLPAEMPGPFGGAVGVIGYDIVTRFEPVPLPPGPDGDDYRFLVPDALAVFDHVKSEIELLVRPAAPGDAARAAADVRLRRLLDALAAPLEHPTRGDDAAAVPAPRGSVTQEEFEAMVRRAQEHILAGDAFQIVLSQRLTGRTETPPFQIYRALRILNPSPYLYYLDFGDTQVIGSSPELLVRKDGRDVAVNPIAGTRPRGQDPATDQALAAELAADAKERAEHVMLVDLGRNDLGRVCEIGSVRTSTFMTIEKYSHVMHLVSRVVGRLRAEHDAFDLLRATFPAGTVSGAPKVRAMQLIGEIEGARRGPYAGAVGYFGPHGDMDLCIGIRTLFMRGDEYFIQAGAGIVADSSPAAEYRETLDKIGALARAVAIAEEGF